MTRDATAPTTKEVQEAIKVVAGALRTDEFGGDFYEALSLATRLEELARLHLPLRAERGKP